MKQKSKKSQKNKDFEEIFGLHAVHAALKNKSRNHKKLIISSNIDVNLTENIRKKINQINTIPYREFIKIYGKENVHQGIVLETTKIIQPKLDKIIDLSKEKKTDLVIMLDHVTDTNNIGSIIRSCSLFNCNSVIVSKDNSPDVNSSIYKVASGALEVVNYIQVTNLARTIEKFKKNNFWVLGFDNNSINTSFNYDFPKKCLFIFGSEGKGLRQLTKKMCDANVMIGTNQRSNFGIDSLNVSNACSIALYEHYKNHK